MKAAALVLSLLGWPVLFGDVLYGPESTLAARPGWTEGIVVDGVAPGSGPVLAAAVSVLERWAADERATDLLFFVGRTPRGVWTLEASKGDGSGLVRADLALAGALGRRRTWRLLDEVEPERAALEAARRLTALADEAGWDETPPEPIEPAPLDDPPDLDLYPGRLVARPATGDGSGRASTVARWDERGDPPARFEAAVWAARAYVARGDWVWVLAKTRTLEWTTSRWHAVFVPGEPGRDMRYVPAYFRRD